MDLHHRAAGPVRRLAVLPAAFDPPTRAHVELAEMALATNDQALLVLPRAFPHKRVEDVSFEDRLGLLLELAAAHPRFSVASVDDGLFISVARDCRAVYGDDVELTFVCGRDAAERVVNWDYGGGPTFAEQLHHFRLLVARRGQRFVVPEALRTRVQTAALCDCDTVSSTEVRERLLEGRPIDDLVPSEIAASIARLYPRRIFFSDLNGQ